LSGRLRVTQLLITAFRLSQIQKEFCKAQTFFTTEFFSTIGAGIAAAKQAGSAANTAKVNALRRLDDGNLSGW
jgi:hypothetical protein